MSAFLASIGLPEVVAGVMLLALNAYAVTGGADFGGGVWDLLARGRKKAAQRTLVAEAIGPIWEANHVWLIVVVVMLFTGFPSAFATLGIVLHIPLALMLVGIVLRGSAFVFRSYGARDRATQRRWGRVFAISSIITPLLLGVVIGAIASGRVGAAAERLGGVGVGARVAGLTAFRQIFVAPWLALFPFAVGALALALFAYLAAVYLALAADYDDALREVLRRQALAAWAIVAATAFVALGMAVQDAPFVGPRLVRGPWALPVQGVTILAALLAAWSLWTRRWPLARLAAAVQVSLVLWGWALAQYPYIIPRTMTIRAAAAPRITLELLLWGLAGGFAILIPSLAYLFRTFAEARDATAAASQD